MGLTQLPLGCITSWQRKFTDAVLLFRPLIAVPIALPLAAQKVFIAFMLWGTAVE